MIIRTATATIIAIGKLINGEKKSNMAILHGRSSTDLPPHA